MSRKRIVVFGADAIVLPTLEFLKSSAAPCALVGVVSQPDRPQGRGRVLTPNPVARWALDNDVPLERPDTLSADALARLRALRPDICLVMAYGKILKDDALALPPLGFLNLHGSFLPAYRGASPIAAAVDAGLSVTGVSLMRVVRKMDAGDVCDAEPVPIGALDTHETVRAALGRACVPLLRRALPRVLDGSAAFAPQDETRVSYTRKIRKDDGALDFTRPAAALAARIRALSPWPSCVVSVRGVPVKFLNARAVEVATGERAGTLLRGQGGLRVATGRGVLEVLELQRPGGRRLPADEFLRGFDFGNESLPSAPMPPLVSKTPFPRV